MSDCPVGSIQPLLPLVAEAMLIGEAGTTNSLSLLERDVARDLVVHLSEIASGIASEIASERGFHPMFV